jgi:hypothetical protein
MPWVEELRMLASKARAEDERKAKERAVYAAVQEKRRLEIAPRERSSRKAQRRSTSSGVSAAGGGGRPEAADARMTSAAILTVLPSSARPFASSSRLSRRA